MTTAARPEVLLSFYGDDFTGSTDALDVTALAGLETVLFTGVPTPEQLARFAGYRVYGIAGTARAQSPDWMEAHLPSAFAFLADRGAEILQYKVCSTFDSGPRTGSVGRAVDIGMRITGAAWSPSVVGAPQLRRWMAFANLFAAAGEDTFRIDRHPTMSRHPVTPMAEGDLRCHVALQTDRPALSIDLPALAGGAAEAGVTAARANAAIAFIDVTDADSQEAAGRLVWENRAGGIFTASSSGLQYALVRHWRRIGLAPSEPPALPPAPPVDRLLVVSGSCSPMTAAQIDAAEAAGFAAIRLDVAALLTREGTEAETRRILAALDAGYAEGDAAVVYAARTVDDPAFRSLPAFAAERGIAFETAQAAIGETLGRIARDSIARHAIPRLVAAGGDTSGRIVSALPVFALEVKHPFATGAPVCHCHSEDPGFDRLELVLKGGQVGPAELFLLARTGGPVRRPG